jgi:uridine phosphorylase
VELQHLLARLAGANPDRFLDREDEDLAVADLTVRACSRIVSTTTPWTGGANPPRPFLPSIQGAPWSAGDDLGSAAAMPARLRPTAPIAADAVLVGDPGRALALAQTLLEKPKMCNHARGLWGYSGKTRDGAELTVQSTGMGGPSAAIVLSDLAETGLRRAVRVGTCAGLAAGLSPGDLLIVTEAHAWAGPGGGQGEAIAPDPGLTAALRGRLGEGARTGAVASLDTLHGEHPDPAALGADAADMQTAALLARGRELGVALAAVLVVTERPGSEHLDDEAVEQAAQQAGSAAASVLSPSSRG